MLPNVQVHTYDVIGDITRKRIFKAACHTENLITTNGPSTSFYHIVFQYNGDPSDPHSLRIMVNGIWQTLNWTGGYENDFDDGLHNIPNTDVPVLDQTVYEFKEAITEFTTASPSNLIAGSLTRTVDGVSMNGITGSMKQLRIYNSAPDAPDLRRNSYDECLMPATKEGLVLWLPLNRADASNKTQELQSGILADITATWPGPATPQYPHHWMPTYYAYNSLNQVVHQQTPDAGQSNFWYDRLGRLVASQNAEQLSPTNSTGGEKRYSYTKFDEQGRIVEVGEKMGSDLSGYDTRVDASLADWYATGTDRQITRTIYDEPDA